MNKTFFVELKRRNVYKAALAYAVVSWLLIQISTQVFPFFEIPNWVVRMVMLLLALGFPVVIVLAWAYELTPEGIKRTNQVPPEQSITRGTGRKLDFLIIGVLVLVVGALLFDRNRSRPASDVAHFPEKSVAVLPFQNMSDNPENAFFADGVQDDILTALAKVADLKVISRTSVMGYAANVTRDLREIGQALRVAHVLEGSVRRDGEKVRVTAQLIDTRTNMHLWAETYDRDLADVFAIQSEIAANIVAQLRVKLSPAEKKAIAERPTADLFAHDLYVRAKLLLNSTTFSTQAKEKYFEAVRLLEEALRRDPLFFLAYYQIAYAHDRIYFFGYDHTPARLALAEAAVKTALRLRPNSGEGHLALAQHLYRGYGDYAGARAELSTARRTLPNDSLVYELTGYIDRRQGHWEESTRNLERALELDPRNIFILQQISISYQKLRRFADQAAVLDRALALSPKDGDTRMARAEVELEWRGDPQPLSATIDAILAENSSAAEDIAETWLILALCKRDANEMDRALAALHSGGINIDGVIFPRSFCTALAARARGDHAKATAAFTAARAEVEKIVRAQPDYAQALCVLGMIDAGLGRKDEALRAGRRAIELLPVARDSVNGAHMIEFFAVICAWIGEKDLACQQLLIATQIPGDLNYGQLRLHPYWDPLRGDPQFENIVAGLAPETADK